ncbi:GerAB/ArcD/ProY family transporter [Paenibacillus agaridevorans]|uniref:GerAB/ArcD/ProY family transporter n=1 Tax=Paenibacillus agaridevorans TaxID=171404 RepID=UPI001BE440FF|nr:endospore germination permease [Paenibacillus agaridevorans]
MKISGLQLFWLIVNTITGLGILFTLSPAIAEAKQDAWISITLAGIIGLCMMILAVKVSLLYPKQTFIQYSQTILGKWLGKILVVPFFMMWYSVSGIILRNSTEFIYVALFNETPLIVLSIVMLILAIYVVYTGGLEGIARCSELIGPIIILMLLGTFILSLNQLDWQQLTPVYADSGWKSILKGATPLVAFYGDIILFVMVFYFLTDFRQIFTRSMWGMAVSSILTIIATAMIIMTFGPTIPSRMWFPFLSMTRFISVLGFIENVDIFVVIIWMFSVFIKLSLYLFVTIYGTAQWLNMKDWKKLIWIVVPIVFLYSLLPRNIAEVAVNFQQSLIPRALLVYACVFLLLLWIVGLIRQSDPTRR